VKVAKALGLKPKLTSVDGGLDANYMNQKGIPTITLGAGQHHPHTVNEYVDIKEYITGCELALALATGT
jgi:tripeptide aminopeptidase